jgi:hypothetical protein
LYQELGKCQERIQFQLTTHNALIKQLYAKAVMMSTISVKKFLTVWRDKLKYVYLDPLREDIIPSRVSSHA